MAIVRSPFLFFHLTFLLSLSAYSQGCTDPLALNYNPTATINDGSCSYSTTSVSPISSWTLPPCLAESSGLIQWNNLFWSHNDNAEGKIYSIDTTAITTQDSLFIPSLTTVDWEEIAQDDTYFYLGDFGNNSSGNRTNLRIFRVLKSSVLTSNPIIDTLQFSYEDQTNFSPTSANTTNFDCEAFVVTSDSIFLFSKQWTNHKTTVYSLPKVAGNFIANKVTEFDCAGLITGASLLVEENVLLLSGYSQYLQPFVWLMYDFPGTQFFNGNKRKVGIDLPFHQIEAINSTNGLDVFMTNERFQQSTLIIPQQFHRFDFSTLLVDFLYTGNQQLKLNEQLRLFPNPLFSAYLNIEVHPSLYPIEGVILDQYGSQISVFRLDDYMNKQVHIPEFKGVYNIKLLSKNGDVAVMPLVKF